MRPIFAILAAGIGLTLNFPLLAGDVDDLLERHYEALGGLDRLLEIDSLRIEGTNRFQNQEISVTYLAKRPNLLRMETASHNVRVIRIFDGETAWQVMRQAGRGKEVTEMEGQDAVELIRESDFDGPLIDYEEKGHRIEYRGSEAWDDREVHRLDVVEAGGVEETYFLDAESLQVVKKSAKVPVEGGIIEFEMYYDDHREVEGLVFPFATTVVSDGQTVFTGTVEEVELNPDFDRGLFEKPE